MNSDEIGFEKIIFEHHAFMTGVSYKKLIKRLREEGYKCTVRETERTAGVSYLGIFTHKKSNSLIVLSLILSL
ncbi:hypothetical protein GWK48_11035 [Metallosphaera tengchongensis]|uniref:Uncharacterized protein n=1 Tax=Metallosphaera tengchongensis TaxID=1532350 RepID=A0A6N0NVJ4_9CREN|nr:hypothetical protein [Metallosphaera tengchongensis]QKR00846.1 hypothetical protein GWK48_11035 [Metallosphaera tengchongensis]